MNINKFFTIIGTIFYLIFPAMLGIFLSGACDASMDTIDQHWEISHFSQLPDSDLKTWLKDGFIDIDKYWFKYLGFPYIIEDGWHFFKGWMWIFAGLVFIYTMAIMAQWEIIKSIKNNYGKLIYLFICGYVFLLWMTWWAGKVIFYYHLLIIK